MFRCEFVSVIWARCCCSFLPCYKCLQCFDTVGWASSGRASACKNWVMRCICLERHADCLHVVQLIPLPPKTSPYLASFKSRLVLPFCYRLTQVFLVKRPLNGCSNILVCLAINENLHDVILSHTISWTDASISAIAVCDYGISICIEFFSFHFLQLEDIYCLTSSHSTE